MKQSDRTNNPFKINPFNLTPIFEKVFTFMTYIDYSFISISKIVLDLDARLKVIETKLGIEVPKESDSVIVAEDNEVRETLEHIADNETETVGYISTASEETLAALEPAKKTKKTKKTK